MKLIKIFEKNKFSNAFFCLQCPRVVINGTAPASSIKTTSLTWQQNSQNT